jgi:hypothetical protein
MTPLAAPFQPQPINGTVYLLEATGGNVALCAGSEGALLVDIPQAADVPRIISEAAWIELVVYDKER